MFGAPREPVMIGSSHLAKRNPISEIDTTSSSRTLRY